VVLVAGVVPEKCRPLHSFQRSSTRSNLSRRLNPVFQSPPQKTSSLIPHMALLPSSMIIGNAPGYFHSAGPGIIVYLRFNLSRNGWVAPLLRPISLPYPTRGLHCLSLLAPFPSLSTRGSNVHITFLCCLSLSVHNTPPLSDHSIAILCYHKPTNPTTRTSHFPNISSQKPLHVLGSINLNKIMSQSQTQ